MSAKHFELLAELHGDRRFTYKKEQRARDKKERKKQRMDEEKLQATQHQKEQKQQEFDEMVSRSEEKLRRKLETPINDLSTEIVNKAAFMAIGLGILAHAFKKP